MISGSTSLFHARHHCSTPNGAWFQLGFAPDAPPGSVSLRTSGLDLAHARIDKGAHAAVACDKDEASDVAFLESEQAENMHYSAAGGKLSFMQYAASGALFPINMYLWTNSILGKVSYDSSNALVNGR